MKEGGISVTSRYVASYGQQKRESKGHFATYFLNSIDLV